MALADITGLLFKGFLGLVILIASLISILIFKFVIMTLIRMHHYRKQGAKCTFRPMIGRFGMMLEDFDKHGDFYHYSKNQARAEPDRFYCTNIGPNPFVILHDTALIKEFYLNTDCYVKEQLQLDFFPYLLGKGLVISEGDQWKKQKKMLSNTFHFEFLNSILPLVQKIAVRRISALKNGQLKGVDLMTEMQNISGEVVGKMFFGEEIENYKFEGVPLTDALSNLITEAFSADGTLDRHIFGLWAIKFIPRHRRMIKKIDDFRNTCLSYVQARKEAFKEKGPAEKKDLVEVLLAYNGDDGKLPDIALVDQFLSFFLPGLDTTGHLLTMTIYHLAKFPEYKAKVAEEIKNFKASGKPLSIEELNKWEFTTAVMKETLRMTTPLNDIFARQAIKDHNLKDLKIKKGDVVNVDFYYNNYNPTYFENPDVFNPYRWLEKDRTRDAYAFIPFSAGPRTCIGQHLAMNETKIILAELISIFDVSVPEDYKLKMTVKFLYGPAEPILFDLTSK